MVQRRGYSEWVKLIEEFEKSASSLEDFSAKLGVKPSTLQFWFYKLRKQASRASRFLPVNVVGRAEGAAGSDRDSGIDARHRPTAIADFREASVSFETTIPVEGPRRSLPWRCSLVARTT